MKFQVLGLRRRIHQNQQLMAQNARIKSAFCKPRLVEFQSTWTQTPDSSNRRLMIQNTKIKSAFCKLRPETFTIRNILSEGPEVQSPWASDCLIRVPVIIPKTASGNQTRFLMCFLRVKFCLEGILPWRPWRTTPCAEEELPLRASVVVALEEEVVGLVFGAMANLV